MGEDRSAMAGVTPMGMSAIVVTVAALAVLGCSRGPSRGPVSVVEQEAWLVTSTTLALGVPSCNGDPVIDRLEETEEQVRIRIVTTTHRNGGNDCLDGIRVRLDEPLGERELIDIPSGEVIELKTTNE